MLNGSHTQKRGGGREEKRFVQCAVCVCVCVCVCFRWEGNRVVASSIDSCVSDCLQSLSDRFLHLIDVTPV